jgi:hypothetical protein
LPDIAVAICGGPECGGSGSSGVYVLYGQTGHTFSVPALIDGSTQPIIAAGDLNGDGRADLVVADAGVPGGSGTHPPGVIHVYLGTAGNSFTASTPTIPTLYFSDLALADVNKDGKLDIVTGATDQIGGNTQVDVTGSPVTLDGTHPSTVTVTIRTNVMAALGRIAAPAALASFSGGVGTVLLVLGMWGAAIRRSLPESRIETLIIPSFIHAFYPLLVT